MAAFGGTAYVFDVGDVWIVGNSICDLQDLVRKRNQKSKFKKQNDK